MNSKIFKKPLTKVDITDSNASGKMLSLKLEAFCETEPSVLLWEVGYGEAPIRQYRDINGKELETSGSDWAIEFQIIRANAILENGLFDGVAIVAGRIKNSWELINGQSQPVYLLSLQSRSLRGEKIFTSAIDLWKMITNLGLKRA